MENTCRITVTPARTPRWHTQPVGCMTVGAVLAAIVGAVVGLTKAPVPKYARLLAASAFGGLCSGAMCFLVVVPFVAAPAMVLFWVGVVPIVSGLATGVVGGLVGIRERDAK